MAVLADAGISMSRIESRPLRGGGWDYRFFVDLLGHRDDPAVAPALAAMARKAPLLYLGSLLIVGLQSTATVAVFMGSIFPSCSSSDQCGAGTYCKLSGTPSTASPRPRKPPPASARLRDPPEKHRPYAVEKPGRVNPLTTFSV